MYKCKHFRLEELLPRKFYEEHKHYGDRLWLIFDGRGLMTIDEMRDRYGKCYINNWLFGGTLQYCGYRPPECSVGAVLSQHRFGRGFDLHFANVTAEEVRREILDGKWPLVKGVELGVSWVHIDFRNATKLVTFRQK